MHFKVLKPFLTRDRRLAPDMNVSAADLEVSAVPVETLIERGFIEAEMPDEATLEAKMAALAPPPTE